MATTTHGVPYPVDGDVPDIPYWSQLLAEFLDPRVQLVGAIAGTVKAPFTGFVSARLFGPLVEVEWNVSGSFPVGNTEIGALGLVPVTGESLAPENGSESPRLAAYLSGNVPGQAYITPSTGLLFLTNQSGATRTTSRGRGIYLR